MGRIVLRTYTIRELELTREDLRKQEERRKRRYNTFPKPTKDMLRFCERLESCPICGKSPEPSIVGEYGDYDIKMNCSGSPFHISCGDWYKSLARAGKSWNRRTKDKQQIRADIEREKRWAMKRAQKCMPKEDEA